MYLVVHIPKTAGSSLRWALEKYHGKSRVIRDYGPQSIVTDRVVHEHVYGKDKPGVSAQFVDAMTEGKSRVLVGHFPLQKYAGYFEPEQIITVMREPLLRACSEYVHRINNKTFKGSVTDFLQKPVNQNLQTRFLNGISERSFIGIAEQYRETLDLINDMTRWRLLCRRKNIGYRGGGQTLAESLTEQELDLFYKLNQKDIELYQDAKQRFNSRDLQT